MHSYRPLALLLPCVSLVLMTLVACGADDLAPRQARGWDVTEGPGVLPNTPPGIIPDLGVQDDLTVAEDLPVFMDFRQPAEDLSPGPDLAPPVEFDMSMEQRDMAIAPDASAETDMAMEPDMPDMAQLLPAADGEPCMTGADCAGGSCIEESQGWPGGYCTTFGCVDRTTCARGPQDTIDNRCLRTRQPLCVRICTQGSDCRQGYECNFYSPTEGYCAPDTTPPITEDFASYPFPVTCGPHMGGLFTYSYVIAPTTTSYMVTTIARDGAALSASATSLPSGGSINYRSITNAFQNATSQLFPYVAPLITPATPALASQLESGGHTLSMNTNSGDICTYKFEESTPGITLDLNIYLVGIPGLDATNAPMSADMTAVLAEVDRIYATAMVSLGTIRYIDASPQDAQTFSIIRQRDDVGRLFATSTRPGTTVDDALSLNVFFVRQLAIGGAIGISHGIPGPAGIHGTQASGVIFTSEYLGRSFNGGGGPVNGNVFTGATMAHEMGHYLGLFHTTEQSITTTDPLTDTPECTSAQFPSACPDRTNLMFPLAGTQSTSITMGQAFMIQANPLTKD